MSQLFTVKMRVRRDGKWGNRESIRGTVPKFAERKRESIIDALQASISDTCNIAKDDVLLIKVTTTLVKDGQTKIVDLLDLSDEDVAAAIAPVKPAAPYRKLAPPSEGAIKAMSREEIASVIAAFGLAEAGIVNQDAGQSEIKARLVQHFYPEGSPNDNSDTDGDGAGNEQPGIPDSGDGKSADDGSAGGGQSGAGS